MSTISAFADFDCFLKHPRPYKIAKHKWSEKITLIFYCSGVTLASCLLEG